MKKYSDILRKCPLFDGMKDEEIDLITERPGAVEKHCVRGETILAEGDPVRYFGIVLSGGAQIVRIDYYGNRSILTDIAPPQIFGEAFACAGLEAMPVDVVATGIPRCCSSTLPPRSRAPVTAACCSIFFA